MPLQSLQRCLRRHPRFIIALYKNTCRGNASPAVTDIYGIPTLPTWSVNELLSSYPSPKLSSSTINRLHELSALIPPIEGSPQHDAVTRELEEMIKLVDAVRLVDTSGISIAGRGERADNDRQNFSVVDFEEAGQDLLKHASQTTGRFYIVDSERR